MYPHYEKLFNLPPSIQRILNITSNVCALYMKKVRRGLNHLVSAYSGKYARCVFMFAIYRESCV